MSNIKRYYSFLLGIIAASVTWSVVLYFYIRLGNDTSMYVSSQVNYSVHNTNENQVYNSQNNEIHPYEDVLSFFYGKKKLYKNSENLIHHLRAVIPDSSKDLGKFMI